ncbi:MAG: hypothetical protein HGGPFJEG_02600 [Ignavibacteria bacterium]|nr:hypothetical protein [Ignavibacteria bacterium]
MRSVSIVIPTFNRAGLLGQTIESCINQTYPRDKFEIIIADNNSGDNTKELVQKYIEISDIPIRYIFEPRQGAHFARNTASKQSESEILYFTDDDMIAEKNMLVNIEKIFDLNYNIAVVGGKVLPKWEFEPPEWLLKYFKNGALSLIEKSEKLIIAAYDIGIYSCHQAIRRDVLIDCGGFNPDIIKDKLIGNGETGLNIKILNKGYNFAYTDDAVTYHVIHKSRMTQKYLNSRFSNQANCDSFTNFRKRELSRKLLIKNIFTSHFPNFLNQYFSSIAKMFTKDDIWRYYRVYAHYYMQRMIADFKLALNQEWRDYSLKYNYLDD